MNKEELYIDNALEMISNEVYRAIKKHGEQLDLDNAERVSA